MIYIRIVSGLLICMFLFNGYVLSADEAEIKKLYIELILDASKSMTEPLNGRPKIDIAKQVLNEVLDDIAPDTYLALRVYGSDKTKLEILPGQSEDDVKRVACSDSLLKVGFGKGNTGQVKQIINSTEATGYTPIAYSLALAGNDFSGVEGNNYIILASDGQETCGGDPIAAVNDLKAKGINVIVHTIGFAVDETARKQLEDIASAAGGNYYSANTADELKDSFKKVIEVIGKEEELFKAKGKEITPGSGFENAALIEAGEYFLGNLATTEIYKHTVKLNAVRGQKLNFSVMFTPGDALGGIYYCYTNAYNKDLQEVFSDYKFPVTKLEPKTIAFWVAPYEEETYYLVFIGTQQMSYQSKAMNVYLKVDIEDRFDATSGKDAPDTFPQAIRVESTDYSNNWIFPKDDNDKYTLKLGKGETLSIKVFPTEDWRAGLKIFNEDREEVSTMYSKNDGAVAKGEYTSKNGEDVYIGVESWSTASYGKYEMGIKVERGEIKDKE